MRFQHNICYYEIMFQAKTFRHLRFLLSLTFFKSDKPSWRLKHNNRRDRHKVMNNCLLFALNKNPSPLRPTEEDAMLGSKTKHVAVTPKSVKGSQKQKANTTLARLLSTSWCSNRHHSFQLLHQQPLQFLFMNTFFPPTPNLVATN